MKITELVKNLEELRKEHGDISVVVFDGSDYCPDLNELCYLDPGEWSYWFLGDRVTTKAIRLR